jgi:uncharacterized membrane protein HdeD (DUF308 family)
MKKPGKKELWQAASFVLCIAVAWPQMDLEGTEFSGGRVTGPIFWLFESGILIFALATLFTFMNRRVGAFMGIAASLLCFPLYFYFIAPGPFRSVFRGIYSVPLQSSFIWDNGVISGMLTLAVAVFVCRRNFSSARRTEIPARTDSL